MAKAEQKNRPATSGARARIDADAGEPAAVWVPASDLKPWGRNPRRNDGKPVEAVVESIKRFGFGAPILARKADGEVIAGHTRLKAAKQLGIERVPVRYLDLDPADAHLLALADNRLGELSEWDDSALLSILGDLRQQDSDAAAVAGWDDKEIDQLLRNAGNDILSGADDPPDPAPSEELRAKWKTEQGQTWIVPSKMVPDAHHVIRCGDSTAIEDVTKLCNGASVEWMWTDPPYGVDYEGKTKSKMRIQNDGAQGVRALIDGAFAAADSVLVGGAPIYVAHPAGPLSLEFGGAFVGVGWRFHETLIWLKQSMVLGHSDYQYRHEPIIYGWKGKNRQWHGGRDKTTVLEVERPQRNELHPTTKPTALIEMCLVNSSSRGNVGIDLFCGSGSTIIAAENSGRLCRGMELDPAYVAVTLERLSLMGLEPRMGEPSG